MRPSFRHIHSIEELQSLLGKNIQVEELKDRNTRMSVLGRTCAPNRESNTINVRTSAAVKAKKPENTRKSLPKGMLNRYENSFLQLLRDQGWTQIGFEIIRIELAHRCWYTPDFTAFKPGEKITFFEVKGFWEDDARVKVKVAARLLPAAFAIKTALYKNKEWHVRDVIDSTPKIASRPLPKMELLHHATGNQLLSVPINGIHITKPTKAQPAQIRLSLAPREVTAAFLRYVLYLQKGTVPPKALSIKARRCAETILKNKSRQYQLHQFRTRWENEAFTALPSPTLQGVKADDKASHPKKKPTTAPPHSC